MIIVCAWCGKPLGEKEPYDDKSVTHGICEACKERALLDAGLCPRCNGPVREIPNGHACDACRWAWVAVSEEPGPAPQPVRDDHAGETLTPRGWRAEGFDSHDPPWRGGGWNY